MLIPINNNLLVELDLKNETENGFTFSEEIKGDGQIVKCKMLRDSGQLTKDMIVYIPFYALRQIKDKVYACDYESVIAYEE